METTIECGQGGGTVALSIDELRSIDGGFVCGGFCIGIISGLIASAISAVGDSSEEFVESFNAGYAAARGN